MKRFSIGAAALALTLMANDAAAAGVIYDCDITNRRERVDWISPKVAVVVKKNGTVQVIDSILIHFNQSPATARVGRNTDKVLTARWRVRNTVDGDGQMAPEFGYDLRINKQKNTIVVGAKPHGFANHFSGRGTCKLRSE